MAIKRRTVHSTKPKSFELLVDTAVKLKKVMQKKNLRRAKTRCPSCAGDLYGQLAGKNNRFRMKCVTPNCMELIE